MSVPWVRMSAPGSLPAPAWMSESMWGHVSVLRPLVAALCAALAELVAAAKARSLTYGSCGAGTLSTS